MVDVKLFPRRWGTKVELSGDPENPLEVLHKEVSVATLTDAQIVALMVFCGRMLVQHRGLSGHGSQSCLLAR